VTSNPSREGERSHARDERCRVPRYEARGAGENGPLQAAVFFCGNSCLWQQWTQATWCHGPVGHTARVSPHPYSLGVVSRDVKRKLRPHPRVPRTASRRNSLGRIHGRGERCSQRLCVGAHPPSKRRRGYGGVPPDPHRRGNRPRSDRCRTDRDAPRLLRHTRGALGHAVPLASVRRAHVHLLPPVRPDIRVTRSPRSTTCRYGPRRQRIETLRRLVSLRCRVSAARYGKHS
jgi:hypothetical protein